MHMTLVTVAKSDCYTFGMFRQFYIKNFTRLPERLSRPLIFPVVGFY